MVETVTVDMGIPTEIVTVNLGEGYGFHKGYRSLWETRIWLSL